MPEQNKIRRHTFQPGAMSIIQMGEQLIGHPSTAINELVKNGYDADALSCKVYFSSSPNSSESFVIVYDNGSGMSYDTLFGDWLKPSVSSKRKADSKSAIYERNQLGSKGIGRLAAMALGENVTVITREVNTIDYNWITVNREAFKEEVLLSAIDFPGDKISDYKLLFSDEDILEERKTNVNETLLAFLETAKLDSFEKGTLIIIESLDDSVLKILKEEHNQLELPGQSEPYENTSFYKALATLITPLNLNNEIQKELQEKKLINNKKEIATSKSKFSIDYGTNLLPDQDEKEVEWLPVEPVPIQSAYDYRIYGKVSKDGDVSGYISYKRLENDIKEESFELLQSDFRDKNEIQTNLFADTEVNETGEYYFDIRIYDIGEKDNLEKLAKESKLKSATEFRSVFKNFQGMRISKNGFGVKPYGDEVEDWIELSKARVQNPGRNVNTNQILGYVFFYSPENDNLEEKTNREGFLENKAFQQVKTTMKEIFSFLGKKRYNYRLLHGLGRVPTSKHERPDFEEYMSRLHHLDATAAIISYSEKFMKEVTTSMDNIEESLSFSERLASLGSGIELVYHEMAQPISGLRTTKSSLDLKKSKISSDALDNFVKDITTLNYATDVLTELRKSLQPAIGRSRSKKFAPYNTFLKVCNLYKSDIDDYKISIVADQRLEKYEITDLEYAFWIAFLNIINNAVYWIKKSETPGEIRFYIEGDSFIISNSGPFINEELIDHIFNYGVTTKSEKNATGLGLAFTQSILSRNDWNIWAENRKDGPAIIIKKGSNE
ncbi:ATP-binding protein [Elizabethkingia meningoseptica]|uniref:ATP-binding protein n=1 Tax=Elizabethkingia meningoseptica TaxID=238 RepID=UPI0038913E33